MFNFVNQSILEQFENLSQVGAATKKGEKPASRIVDASDMQALMVCLPYLLDGLADDEIEAHAEEGEGQVTLCMFYELVMNVLF